MMPSEQVQFHVFYLTVIMVLSVLMAVLIKLVFVLLKPLLQQQMLSAVERIRSLMEQDDERGG